LKQNNIQDFNSLVELVPGMVAQDEDKIAIRGISRTREGPSPVAFHVNDVFIAMRGEPFYDLEAVEILRGPSGTLFGRNAT
ncbi:MAG TPA: TonB-dependent receptor, partial [Spongiibacteraceae bacterium]|nr:TonB-dependent receptor [Spongiibacteraceae bacterium]